MPSLKFWFVHVTILSVVGISATAFIAPKLSLQNVAPHTKQHYNHIIDTATSLTATSNGSDTSSTASGANAATNTITNNQSPVAFVENLLLQLSSPDNTNKGQILLEASSEKWRQAIYQAIGAPTTATDVTTISESIIAKSLQHKMSRSDSQFAILMGHTNDASITPFTIAFPSDIVDYRNDGTVWLECQLRHADTNKLFVIMGMNLISDEATSSSWKILSLDWQDFREQFYPGLSGREWLRAF